MMSQVAEVGVVEADGATSRETVVFRRVAWRLLPILMVAYLCSYIDRINVGFAKLQMADALSFSDAVYGFGAGIFFLGYFLFEVPSNLILHRVGARVWIARIMITWGLISAATMFVQTPMQFYIARFLLGLGEAGFLPGVIYYLTQWFPSYWRGRVLGVFYIALAVSGVVGAPLSGAIMQYVGGAAGIAGWQWLFLLEALPTILVGLLVLRYLDDSPAKATWLDPSERSVIDAALAMESRNKVALSFKDLFSNKYLLLMTGAFFINNFAVYGLNFWMPTLIKAMGVDGTFAIGMTAGATSLFAIASMTLVGRSADRNRERRWHLAGLFLCGALGFVITAVGERSAAVGVVGLCLAQLGILAVPAMFWPLPTAILGGVGAAAGIALINSIANLSGFLGPYVVGFIKDQTGSTLSSIYFIAALLVLAAVLILMVPAKLVNR
jgi:MFS family permease